MTSPKLSNINVDDAFSEAIACVDQLDFSGKQAVREKIVALYSASYAERNNLREELLEIEKRRTDLAVVLEKERVEREGALQACAWHAAKVKELEVRLRYAVDKHNHLKRSVAGLDESHSFRAKIPPALPEREESKHRHTYDYSVASASPKPVIPSQNLAGSERGIEQIWPSATPMQRETGLSDTQYAALFVLQRRFRAILVTRKWKRLVCGLLSTPTGKRVARRNAIAREVIESEESYVKGLNLLLGRYMMPLLSGRVPSVKMSKGEISDLFSNLIIIINLNQHSNIISTEGGGTLLQDLLLQQEQWPSSPRKIGTIFANIAPFLKCYIEYVNNYKRSLAVLARWRQRRPFSEWLKELKETPVVGDKRIYDLEDYLILPIQRIPRYVMLLKELKQFTVDGHCELEGLKKANDSMAITANLLNEQKRKAEGIECIYGIQKKVVGDIPNLVKPHRRLVREGNIKIIEGKKITDRHVFLFNDLMLVTADNMEQLEKKQKWKCETIMPLRSAVIKDVPMEEIMQGGCPRFTVARGAQIVTFGCVDETVKAHWLRDLGRSIANLLDSFDGAEDDSVPNRASRKVATHPSRTFMEGHLYKRGEYVKSWKRKWCVVENSAFLVYRDAATHIPSDSYALDNVSIRPVDETSGRQFCFEVTCRAQRRAITLSAEDKDEYEKWMGVIRGNVVRQATSINIPTSPPPAPIGSPPVRVIYV